MDTLYCKAASPDNKFEMQSIVELFEAVYGDTFPLSSVYNMQYWQQHIGKRFTSILVYQGRKLVGHLAAQPEGSDGKMVQILFPLCHPSLRDDCDQILETAWAMFEKQACRQQWQGIYYFAIAHAPEMVQFGERVLKVKSIAFCPAYFPALGVAQSRANNSLLSERADIIVGQRFFTPEHEKQRSIYVGKDHVDLVSKLYRAINLPRDIKTAANRDKLSSYPLPADRSAIETRFYAKSGILHAYIEPSLLTSESELAKDFLRPHSDSTFIFVKAYDPRALEVAEWLEANEYEFSGILPFVHDRESLLFSHTNSESIFRAEDTESLLLSGFSTL